MIRTFVAAQLEAPPALAQVLQDLRGLGPAIRPVAANNLHVTLKFLGDTVEQALPQIGEVVSRTASGHSRCV
ncbi:MAG TPA: 2'-5' RNA ligase family protein, partial [Planctomycetaceae bacterium]|nr:2'-5' RNA ligase family protein [Planctomycetaceae bacterium]